jgi:hypothetical protein
MALFHVVHRLGKSLKHKELVLGAFLDIEGAFDNSSFHAFVEAAREHGLEETCCSGSDPCLQTESYTLLSWAAA